MPACQIDTFSAFQVLKRSYSYRLGGHHRNISSSRCPSILCNGDRMQVNYTGGELAVFFR